MCDTFLYASASESEALVLFFDTLPRSAHALACWEYGARILGDPRREESLEDFGGCLVFILFYIHVCMYGTVRHGMVE